MFAITGITGQVGGVIGRTLLAEGVHVRAVVRDAAKGRSWAERGCEVAVAAMDDAPALERAFTGTKGVFILLPPCFDPSPGFTESRRIIGAIRSAIEAAQPERVVCLSTIGAQAITENLLSQLGLLEHSLGELSLPIAFLRPAWFLENISWDIASARQTGVVQSFLQPLDRRIPMVGTADVGRTAARLLRESWTGQRVVELEGPQRLSPNDLAAGLTRVLSRPVTAECVPRKRWETLFRAQGMRNPLPRMRMLDGFNEGWIDFQGKKGQYECEPAKGGERLDAVVSAILAREVTCP